MTVGMHKDHAAESVSHMHTGAMKAHALTRYTSAGVGVRAWGEGLMELDAVGSGSRHRAGARRAARLGRHLIARPDT